MQFQNIDTVAHPVEAVFALLKDEMELIVPYLPDVEEIVVVEKEARDDGTLRIVNMWRGSSGKAPKVVQKFLSPDLLSWKDHAIWHSDVPRHAEWRLEPKVGGKLFECDGKTYVEEVGPGKTQIKVMGDLRVYPERLPGVPRLLAGRVRSHIESFVVDMLVPNMQTLARGVQAYFDDKQSGAI